MRAWSWHTETDAAESGQTGRGDGLPDARVIEERVCGPGVSLRLMKQAIQKYLEYLRSVRNSSPHTVLNYGKDLERFAAYLSPPGVSTPAVADVTHQVIREYVGHLHSHKLEKSSIARKLASLRSFFKFCVREGTLKENPARLVPTPKLPKRIPSVLSAEEMNGFLDQLAGINSKSAGKDLKKNHQDKAERKLPRGNADEDGLLIKRDRAILELL